MHAVYTSETYNLGDVIIREGATSTCFYILEKGAVEIFIGDTLLNVVMYPGSIFGEVAFISRKPRTGSIVARANKSCVSLTATVSPSSSTNIPRAPSR